MIQRRDLHVLHRTLGQTPVSEWPLVTMVPKELHLLLVSSFSQGRGTVRRVGVCETGTFDHSHTLLWAGQTTSTADGCVGRPARWRCVRVAQCQLSLSVRPVARSRATRPHRDTDLLHDRTEGARSLHQSLHKVTRPVHSVHLRR